MDARQKFSPSPPLVGARYEALWQLADAQVLITRDQRELRNSR